MLAGLRPAWSQQPPKTPPLPTLPPGVKVVRDTLYVEGGHERNRLDLYLPEKTDGPLPIVVWVHGGGWQAGNKLQRCPARPLAAKGYAVASINYRLSQHATFPAQIEDCKAAIRWLRANAAKYHLDPQHVGVWGLSAGGHLVGLLGTTGGMKEFEGNGGNLDQSSRVQAVAVWCGPMDFTADMGPDAGNATQGASRLIGGPLSKNKDKARRASPITYVSRDAAPFLILHGDKDTIVPMAQSERFAEALKKAGVEVTLHVVKGGGHGDAKFQSPENMKLVEDFFAKHLGKSQAH
jgi:acetyl esterase/lipase